MVERWPAVIQCAYWTGLSAFLITAQLAIVRHIGADIHVFEIIFFRGIFGVLTLTPLLAKSWQTHLAPNRPWLNLLCGTIAFFSSVSFFFAALYVPLADIMAFLFARPVTAGIFAAIVLREALTRSRIIAVVLGIIGALIIVRPGLVEFNSGYLFVLGTLAFRSWNPINRRMLSKVEHPDTIAVWNIIIFVPYGLLLTFFVWTTPTLVQMGWMALVGVMETYNQRCIARAYRKGDAIIVTGMQYTRLPVAALAGFLIFDELPDEWIWVGAAVIAVAATILARGEMIEARDAKEVEQRAPIA
jgi:drug/metabolite transporter (DMT)-like permease